MKCCFERGHAYTGLSVFPLVKQKVWVCDNCKSIICPCGCKKAYRTIDKFRLHITRLQDSDLKRFVLFQIERAKI